MKEHPKVLQQFNNQMAGYAHGGPMWMDPGFYPVKERLEQGLEAGSDVLLVDVGGGMGQDLIELKSRYPKIRGRLILQDGPDVIKQIKYIADGIVPTVHDFLTLEPVKGII